MPDSLDDLTQRLRDFARERNWAPFHAPKNLACALSVEAAELLEHFQWLGETQSRTPDAATLTAVRLEAADVLLYLLQFADSLGIDLIAAGHEKMALNALKYPVETARGSSEQPAG